MGRNLYLAASLILTSCATARPVAGTATLILKPLITAGRIGQTTINPYTQASVHHLELKIFTGTGPEQDTGIAKTLLNAQLENPVVFANLKANTTYRIRAYAYDAASQLISTTDAGSYTDITITTDDRPTVDTLKVKLIDIPFNGQASSTIGIVPGGYAPIGSESLAIPRIVTTIAGSGSAGWADGFGSNAMFNRPYGIAADSQGYLYVADESGARIRRVSPTGVVTTLAGSGALGYLDGTGTSAKFNHPDGVAVDAAGNVYVADEVCNAVRKISPSGVVSTLAGNGTAGDVDGTGLDARLRSLRGVAVDNAGNVYITDSGNHKIKKITSQGVVTTLAGSGSTGAADGQGTLAQFNTPRALVLDSNNNIYVIDTLNQAIRKVTQAGLVSTIAGNGVSGYADGQGTSAMFKEPQGIAIDPQGNLYVADSNNFLVRKVDTNGMVTTFAGTRNIGATDGPATAATFSDLRMLTVDAFGNLYVADLNNHKIRKIY